VLRWLLGLVVAAILSVFTALLLHGEYVDMGPVVLTLTRSHGVHRGDILVAGGWLIGIIAVLTLVLDRSQGDRDGRGGTPGRG
jgi:predicted outer membrane lipoprotein